MIIVSNTHEGRVGTKCIWIFIKPYTKGIARLATMLQNDQDPL